MTISGGYGYLDYFYQNNFDKRVLEPEQMFRPVGRAAVVVPGSSGAPAAAGGHRSTSPLSRGAVLPRAAGCAYRCYPRDLGKKRRRWYSSAGLWEHGLLGVKLH